MGASGDWLQRLESARGRRRSYLESGLRKRPEGSGSNLGMLMQLQRTTLLVTIEDLFGDIPAVVVGGVATRAYAPERYTKDLDFLVAHERYTDAILRLEALGWRNEHELVFPDATLGPYGATWSKDGRTIDVISTDQSWACEALAEEVFDQTGLRVISLPYLVLTKLDSARVVDQEDLTRMLGRAGQAEIDCVVRVVERHYGEPHVAEDIRQYATLGAMEYEVDRKQAD